MHESAVCLEEEVERHKMDSQDSLISSALTKDFFFFQLCVFICV